MSRTRKRHDPPRHGTLSGYTVDGCRAECCRSAHRAYMNRYRTRRGLKGGIMVDAAIVHQHLDRCLSAGMTPHDIVKAAGWKSRNNIDSVRVAKKVRPETARRVLSIIPRPGAGRPMTYTRADYTRDRLRVLVEGRTQKSLALELGMSPEALSDILAGRVNKVRRATALRVLSAWHDHLYRLDELRESA